MMTKEEQIQTNKKQETFIVGVLEGKSETIVKINEKLVAIKNNEDNCISSKNKGTIANINKTQYKLSFSVDRILNNNNNSNNNLTTNNGLTLLQNLVKNDNNFYSLNSGDSFSIDICSFEKNEQNKFIGNNCCNNICRIADLFNSQKLYLDSSRNSHIGCSGDLVKSIVRPTPIRIRKTSNSVLTNNVIPAAFNGLQAVLKHQQENLTGFNTLNSLKSLHNVQVRKLGCNSRQQDSSTIIGTSVIRSSTIVAPSVQDTSPSSSKRKRSWSRAVFSNLQRKGLEIQFQQQKYITKPDRRKLASRLNLTDAQVKVWFQNRRMKWRHTRENLKSGQEKSVDKFLGSKWSEFDDEKTTSEEEIDVVTE